MAETLTVNDAPENTGELTADEKESLQVGEQLAKEQGELLAGKYKNAEDLEKAYIELQKKLGEESTEEISEISDPTMMEEIPEDNVVEEQNDLTEDNAVQETEEEETSVSQSLKLKFIEGGPLFMSFVLIALILGLALSIERIIYLNLATTNSKKLLEDIEAALTNGGEEQAKEVCRNTRGPVASIFLQGLERSSEGIEMVEKSVIAYGGVQMGLLERGLSWIGLFIALAPMLGFMGTVIGMIQAFDIIELKGEAKPDELAGGIKLSLIHISEPTRPY